MGIRKATATGPSGQEPAKLIDRAEVYRAAAILIDPATGVQIQGLPSGSFKTLDGDDIDAIVEAAESVGIGNRGVYFTMNPTDPALAEMSKNPDMLRRRWILIDFDPKRETNTNSSEDEHEEARDVAGRVQEALWEAGWPSPVVSDSGNGIHLLYRVDLPNDDDSKTLIRDVLHALGDLFDTPVVQVDRGVFAARQICKLPGTFVRKGPHSEERPHRWAKLLYVPETCEIVPVEKLHEVRGWKQNKPAPAAGKVFDVPSKSVLKLRVGDDRMKAYAAKAFEVEMARIAIAPKGAKNNTINDACFRLGTLAGAGALDKNEIEAMACHAARVNGCFDDVESEKKTLGTIRRAIQAGVDKPRDLSALHNTPTTNGIPTPATMAAMDEQLIVFAHTITPKKVQWLWPGRIPLGKLTTFAGSGGLGKTFVLTDIAARVTRGEEWPDKGLNEKAGSVLYISGEDDPEDTLVPRLIAAGGVREKVAYFRPEVLGGFSLQNIDLLDRALDQVGADCRLVAIDPPTSFLCGVDDHKNAELRQILTPLSEWATKRRVAVVFITHINKGGAGKVDAQMRIIGSVAWANAVRAAHMFVMDPEESEKRLFVGVKVNAGKARKALSYRIDPISEEEPDGPARVIWLGEVDTTANDALAGTHKTEKRSVQASKWLIEKFRERNEWPSKELFQEAANENIKENALWEARKLLDLPKCRKVTTANAKEFWIWWVPADWQHFNSPEEEVI